MKKTSTLFAIILFSLAGFAQQFTKVTGSVVTNVQESNGSAWADYDKDGDLDLFVTIFFPSVNNLSSLHYLFQNNCNGDFTRITAIPGGLVSEPIGRGTAAWIDYNNDGNDDLFIFREGDSDNFLYRNNGDGTFTKITNLPFLIKDPDSPTLSGGNTFIDYDNDGDLDVYVANQNRFDAFATDEQNDFIPNQLRF